MLLVSWGKFRYYPETNRAQIKGGIFFFLIRPSRRYTILKANIKRGWTACSLFSTLYISFFFLSYNNNGMSNENEPLLGQPEVHQEPTFWSSFKVTVYSSYINYFLIFVPIAIAFSILDASPTVVFTLNFIAIIPLAKLLGFGTVNPVS